MPWQEVMHKWKHGNLHSGSKSGPKVSNQKQAIAIMLSEKHKGIGPSDHVVKNHAPKKG